MKETEVVQITETETVFEEQEVERTYCDECGERCGDDHKVVAKDVCYDCSDESTADRLYASATPDDVTEPWSLDMVLLALLLWPLVLVLGFGDLLSDEEANKAIELFVVVGTTVIWTVAIIGLLLLI